ncbi:hypothetical protein ACJX0J_016125, partial [Zea mays]
SVVGHLRDPLKEYGFSIIEIANANMLADLWGKNMWILMDRISHLFWTPCANIGKIKEFLIGVNYKAC